MAKKSKLFSDKEIQQMLKNRVNEIVEDVKEIGRLAIDEFYDKCDNTTYYDYRTNSFYNIVNDYEIKKTPNGYDIIFTYSSKNVTVGLWPRWGYNSNYSPAYEDSIHGDSSYFYGGKPEEAFRSGFIYGFHGGPHIKYGWTGTYKSRSPWDTIVATIDKLF